jgi:hypothetical protein
MIYESLESTFGAVEGLFRSLKPALEQYGTAADAAGDAEGQLLVDLSTAVDGPAAAAVLAAEAAPDQPDLPTAIQAGLDAVAFLRGELTVLRDIFDPLATALGTSGDRSRCEQLFDRIAEVLRRARQDLEEAGTSPEGPAVNIARVRSTVDDLAAYPVLTSESGGAFR